MVTGNGIVIKKCRSIKRSRRGKQGSWLVRLGIDYTQAQLRETGIYAIRNKANGKSYVGSASQSFRGRWSTHESHLRRCIHYNRHLQHAWVKYGCSAFKWVILEYCPPEKCIEREQYWIDELFADDVRFGYNVAPLAGSRLGVKHTEEAKAKMRESLAKRKKNKAGYKLVVRLTLARKAIEMCGSGMSYRAVAQELGVPFTTIATWVRGEVKKLG